MNRKAAIVITCVFILCGLMIKLKAQPRSFPTLPSVPQTTANPPQQQPQTQLKTAEQVFKNIQVLKGVPADQLIPTMQFIAGSLGVECDFCHVQGGFDKDDKKPKQIARKMMEMMFSINADNFDRHRAVTCNSCHRGSIRPQAIPTVMDESPESAVEVNSLAGPSMAEGESKPAAGPTADQILENIFRPSEDHPPLIRSQPG